MKSYTSYDVNSNQPRKNHDRHARNEIKITGITQEQRTHAVYMCVCVCVGEGGGGSSTKVSTRSIIHDHINKNMFFTIVLTETVSEDKRVIQQFESFFSRIENLKACRAARLCNKLLVFVGCSAAHCSSCLSSDEWLVFSGPLPASLGI